MRHFSFGLVLSLGLGGCLSTTQVTSSTGNNLGTSSASGGNGTAAASSTSGVMRGTSTGGGTSGGGNTTGGSNTGSPQCVTAADCTLGEVCLDGGSCGSPIFPTLNCVGVGDTCSPNGTPCCQGSCGSGGFCTAWTPCGALGAGCQATSDCCVEESCDAGACTPSCGSLSSPCARDSDCCFAEGLVCRPPKVPNGNAMECVSEYGGPSCTPTAQPGTTECNLGTACQTSPANQSDPCAPAGYVCDAFLGVCRDPYLYDSCVPGGPPCQGISGTSVDDLRCIVLANGAACFQACQESSDCVDISTTCGSLGGGDACLPDYSSCTQDFGPCSSEGMSDGTCIPIEGVGNLCEQAALDAGVTCNDSANRQSGGLCGVGDYCIAGLCAAVCNAGTTGTPGCDSGVCLGNSTHDPVDYGFCEQACDFTDLDGGGCPSSAEVPEKCIAAFMSGFPDNGNGLCALASPNPPAIGQHCSQQNPTVIDECGPGAACAALENGSEVICARLCENPGTRSDCPAGQTCQFWYSNGVRSSVMGSCG